MSWVMPEIVLQKILQTGIKALRADKPAFLDLFCQYNQDELSADYGADYIEQIWQWFATVKIPVVQAWSFNATRVPSYSIRLASELEDEQKAALYDLAYEDFDGELGTGVFTVSVDIGIHANKSGDHVLWLYYIASYILFKHKRSLERLGLKLTTYSASDYNREPQEMGDNIWTRWIRLKMTTQNFWKGNSATQIDDVNLDPAVGNEEASSIAVSLDVDPEDVDPTANKGVQVSRIHDEEGIEDLGI